MYLAIMVGNMIKYILITVLFFIPFINVAAQSESGKPNISGQWLGTITQNEGGYASSYEFEIYISQTGNRISGRSYSKVDDLYTILELRGELKSGTLLFFEETKIVDVKLLEDLDACFKKAQMTISYMNGKPYKMKGFWTGKTETGDCIPGEISLFKIVPRA